MHRRSLEGQTGTFAARTRDLTLENELLSSIMEAAPHSFVPNQ